MTENTPERGSTANDDALKAIKLLALKAGIFIGIPIIASVVAVIFYLG